MAARRPFWKWHRWKSIGFCLWPPSTCIWNLKLKFESKLELCSGNHVVYRQTDGQTDRRTDKVNPVYPPSNFVGRGYKYASLIAGNTNLWSLLSWWWIALSMLHIHLRWRLYWSSKTLFHTSHHVRQVLWHSTACMAYWRKKSRIWLK